MKKSFLLGVVTGAVGMTYVIRKVRVKDFVKNAFKK